MPHLIFLEDARRADDQSERLRAHATPELARARLPASDAIRAEIAAMLEAALPDPPELRARHVGPWGRVRLWLPRLGLWLRTMPLP